MIVDSCLHEFGYELLSALPYAKYLHSQGQLSGTISGVDTSCLYYFSPKHTEIKERRSWHNHGKANIAKLPNVNIHTPKYDFSKWENPGLKERYANDEFIFEKPIVCICNRKNIEWGKEAINYFSLGMLDTMFNMLKDKFQIVYFNIEGQKELYDHEQPISLGDYDFIKEKHPEVKVIHDLVGKYSFNETQLRVFSNSEYFITMNGGYSILAAYFGGKNIIYTKKDGIKHTREIGKDVNSFVRWYPKLSGQQIKVVYKENSLYDTIKYFFVDEIPTVNILTRTCKRPNYFDDCMKSIYNQTYKNINIIVSIDDKESDKYTVPHSCTSVYVNKVERKDWHHFPYNNYLNEMYKHCYPGYIIHLDDDDQFTDNEAIEKAVNTGGDMIIWKVQYSPDRVIPTKKWLEKPDYADVCSNNYMFSTDLLPVWKPKKGADYDAFCHIFDNAKNIHWWNEILTGLQDHPNYGQPKDKNTIYANNFEDMDMNYIVSYNGKLIEINVRDARIINKSKKGFIVKKSNFVKVELNQNIEHHGEVYKQGETEVPFKLYEAIVKNPKLGKVLEDLTNPHKDFIQKPQEVVIPVVEEKPIEEVKEVEILEEKPEQVPEEKTDFESMPDEELKKLFEKKTGKKPGRRKRETIIKELQ